MAKKTSSSQADFNRIPFRMHPRVFAALGADLVTNDVVAIIELVKNSYDAFSQNVWVRFGHDSEKGDYLKIQDDGDGMTKDIIENVWCVVATPYKEQNPFAKSGSKKRRVAGEKGLGRLSAARLGTRFNMLTQAKGTPCWEVNVNWSEISQGDDMSACFAECRKYPGESPFLKTGTRLRVYGLKTLWNEAQLSDLEDNLSRLISPFAELGDFNITLSAQDEDKAVGIEASEFLFKPKYTIKGEADRKGNIKVKYQFSSIDREKHRTSTREMTWEQIYDLIRDRNSFPFSQEKSHCGYFSFEIRAWDLGPDDTLEMSQIYEISKTQIRKAIGAHKGVSVYRDGILVLPKSDKGRDWLGLDLRRVSKVGTRMSTSQLAGYVSVSADENPSIGDTSDRERLASCLEVAEFGEILKVVIGILENERDQDRVKREKEKPMDDLLAELSAEHLLEEMSELAEEGADISEAIPLVKFFDRSLVETREEIQGRLVYYSRLATIGTIAQKLVHEIRDRTSAIGGFIKIVSDKFSPFKDDKLKKRHEVAEHAVNTLELLADKFLPLASRSFRRRNRNAILEDEIKACISMQQTELDQKNIQCHIPSSTTKLAVDPGELDSILLNLISNSIFWLGEVPKDQRELDFRLVSISNGKRIRVWVHDSGPGIVENDLEKVFLPGMTRKPGGFGMGLVVASELVAAYGGEMTVKYPGTKGGASFAFDLPLKK